MKKTTTLFSEYLGVTFIVGLLTIILLKFLNLNNLFINLAFWLLRGMGIAVLVYFVRRINDGWNWRDIGFHIHQSWARDIRFGFIGSCLLYLVQLPFAIINLSYQARLLSHSFTMFSEMPIHIMLPVATLAALIFGFITGAWHEEILYRGYLQGIFSKKVAPAVGFFISLILFGITHHFSHPDYNLLLIIIVLINGAFFCLVYYATGSLLVSMTTHTLSNTLTIYAPLLYTRGHEVIAYITALGIGVILLGFCFIANKETKKLFNKFREIFSRSKPVHSIMGILLGILLVFITWGKSIFTDYFEAGTRIVVYGVLGIIFLTLCLRIRKLIKTIIISIVLIGLSLYIYFGFHALRIQVAVHKINNKTFDQEIDTGVNPVFDHIPEGWNAPMKQSMNTIWKPLGIKGMNYFTFGKPKTVFSNYIERSNPRSPFYQAWFGVYVISSKNTCFGIENGKINIFELGKLAEYDQRAWLNAMGDPDPQARWIGFTTLDSLLIDESNRIFYEGVIETHSDLTNKITGQLTTFLGMPPGQEWQQQLSSFHPVTLKGIYAGWYDKQHQVTIVVYGCGVDSIQSKSGKIAGQYDTIKEDLIEMAKRIRIVRIENNK